jgi:hypothetical protein
MKFVVISVVMRYSELTLLIIETYNSRGDCIENWRVAYYVFSEDNYEVLSEC